MKKIQNGLLVSLEGVDGCGKSTLAAALHKQLMAKGYTTLLTKEPGGTPFGDIVRPLVLHRTCRIDAKAEYLLFAAARAQHFDEVVLPALEQGAIVISDRMADSSLVYQGYTRGLELSMLETMNRWTMSNRTPDITFYLQLPLPQVLHRIATRNSSLTDFEKQELLEKSIHGFEEVFRDKDHVVTLDATLQPQVLTEYALVTVLAHAER